MKNWLKQMDKLKLFGADWCPKTALIRNFLQSEWVDFEYLNVEENDDAKEELMKFYDGKVKFPTLSYGEDFVKNPKVAVVRDFLKTHKIE